MKKEEKTATIHYPFKSKKNIAERLETDDLFVGECLQILATRTEYRKGVMKLGGSNSLRGKACGFMRSHEKAGLELAKTNEGWNTEQLVQARALCLRYTTQLAHHFRQADISDNPELAEVAETFSAK